MNSRIVFLSGFALFPLFLTAQTDTLYTQADTTLAQQLLETAQRQIDSAQYDAALENLEVAGKIYGQSLGEESADYARVLVEKARCFFAKEEYDRSLDMSRIALAIQLKTIGADHPDVATSYNILGNVFYSKHVYDLAIEYHQKALAIRVKSLGPEHPQVANSCHNIGNACHAKNDYGCAVEYNQKALAIRMKTLGSENPGVAQSYNNLGIVYNSMKNYDLSIENYQKSLSIRIKIFGAENPVVASSYYNLGNAYYNKGDYGPAVEYHQKAVEIRLKVFGREHPLVAVSYNNLANACIANGEYGHAIEFHRNALDIRLKVLKPEHPFVALSYSNLGAAYSDIGEYSRAIEFHRKALELRLTYLGPEHLNVASSYNYLGNSHYLNDEIDSALECYQKALAIRLKTLGAEHPDVAMVYSNLGNIYRAKTDYNQAMEHCQKALTIRLNALGAEHSDVAESYTGLGLVYHAKGDYDQAFMYYNKSLAIQLKYSETEPQHIATSYLNLGNVCNDKGDNHRAFEYFRKSLNIRLKIFGTTHPEVAKTYNGLGVICYDNGDYDRAIEHYQMALAIQLKILGTEHSDLASTYNCLGNACRMKGDHDLAAEYFLKSLAIDLIIFGADHPNIALYYHNLSTVYEEKGDFDNAIAYRQKTLAILLKAFGERHPVFVKAYHYLGTAHGEKGDYDRAFEYCHKARVIGLETLGPVHPDIATTMRDIFGMYRIQRKFDEGEPYIWQSLRAFAYADSSSLSQVNSLPELIEALERKCKFYRSWFTYSKFLHNLHTARQACSEADAAIAYQRQQLENPGSKTWLAKVSVGIYEEAIAVNHLLHRLTDSLHYWHEAFDYAEKSKSLSLYESIKETDALHYAGIPDSLLEQEYDLRVDIAYREKTRRNLMTERQLPETDTAVLNISGKLFDLNRNYESLKRRFEADFPDYYRLKYDLSTVSVAQVQTELLRPGQTLLEYFVGDSSIFLFAVGQQTFKVIDIKKDFPLEEWVTRLRRMLTDSISAGPAVYCDLAHRLWQKLLLPAKDLLTEELIIIPDGVLGYLPFEALLVERPQNPLRFLYHYYLLRDHRISYCYSATMLREMLQKQHRQNPTNQLLAIAPFFWGDARALAARVDTTDFLLERALRDTLSALPASGEEVVAVTKLWKGRAVYGTEASVEQFRALAARYRILHLSTHGKADDRVGDYAFLAFGVPGDTSVYEKLYARDLYDLRLNADLVVLSACETGIGKLERGEGIISLSRAFAYSGAKSVVTSLWKVNDEKTADLMLRFHRHLKKGVPKDEALRQAKLGYLAKCEPKKAHPYYWAGFLGIGDMGALGF